MDAREAATWKLVPAALLAASAVLLFGLHWRPGGNGVLPAALLLGRGLDVVRPSPAR